jgi:hypothetical protein
MPSDDGDDHSVSTVTGICHMAKESFFYISSNMFTADESPIVSDNEEDDEKMDVKELTPIKTVASIKVTENLSSPSKWEVKTMAARKQSKQCL